MPALLDAPVSTAPRSRPAGARLPGGGDSASLRLTFLALLVVSLFLLLFARLWFLQVMAGDRYVEAAEGQAVRAIALEAPRGDLLDRDGELLAGTRYAQVVSVRPEEMGDDAQRAAVLADLGDLLGLSVAEIEARIADARAGPISARPIAFDVPDEIVYYLHENRSTRYPGVYAERLPLREYPHGRLAAHLLGYTGEISGEELEQPAYADYDPGDVIGWSGVEASYEQVLQGEEGSRRVLVNRLGEVVGDVEESAPVAGSDLQLTIDLAAQQLVEEALQEGIGVARETGDDEGGPGRGGTFAAPAGAVVVLEPETGEVVAMTSFPDFDPGAFVGGIGQSDWDFLNDESNHFPLINRATASSFPPGSVFKIVTAAAALQHGFTTAEEFIECPGEWTWGPNTYRNWNPAHSGSLNLPQALQQSCDTVFYALAQEMYLREDHEVEDGDAFEYLPDMARSFGLGQATGIDLPSDRGGVVPGSAWRREYWESARDTYCYQADVAAPGSYAKQLFSELCSEEGAIWRGGDLVNMSIGQGDVQTTPLQVANTFAAIANRGPIMTPHVVRATIALDGGFDAYEPAVQHQVAVDREHLDVIEQGLLMVTAPGGTAGVAFEGFPVPIAGKTGTAEFGSKQPFAWFAAYNPEPVDGQRYVVAVMVEEGGGGSQTAAPIARRIFEGLLGVQPTEIVAGEVTD